MLVFKLIIIFEFKKIEMHFSLHKKLKFLKDLATMILLYFFILHNSISR